MSEPHPRADHATRITHIEICIVGMGPRGTSTFERLLASAPELLPTNVRLTIHVVDPYSPGPGHIWRTSQSSNLLMNTVACQVTLFTDPTVACSGPIREGPSLIKPNDYPTRALQQLGKITEGVEVEMHAERAISLKDEPSGLQALTLSYGHTISGLSSIILAQGHLPLHRNIKQIQLSNHTKGNNLLYFPPSNPADVDLSSITAGESVLLRGLGLCFFDYMSLLTIGRLRYYPSGFEPCLHASSRRGIPYHSRGDNQKGAFGRRYPIHLTGERIARLRKSADAGNAPDFRRDIWPHIAKDVELVYYECLVGHENHKFRSRFLEAQRGNGATEGQVLDEFNVPESKRWSWSQISQPYGERTFSAPNKWKSWLLRYLDSDVKEAKLGNVQGPIKAALDMLRDLRNEIRQLVDHGGLSGDSQQHDLDGWYTSLNAFLSIGPPRKRIEQMIALIEAGVLNILGPELEVCETDRAWLARSRKVSDSTVRITTLIDAHIPQPNLKHTDDELLSSLLKTGQCRPHTVEGYETGGLDVTSSPYNPIDSRGRAHDRRFVLGVPTEGVHWVTAVGARPGVNSVFLQDTDAVARAALCRGRADVET
ncbi:FAD-NAD(P)-binding-domain-containing protein [Annulohypoxylon maeteangense]|uniref:FAD-NAD(P)-binding-domain-containing protein n=1 Tax=Annulohypoxylon maeteangense TaxID=1927788 RepID=UPI002007EB77|nr:FAD-NAD(P)-binding-domain-containing protein [Annulohypoxylon maeteangense]KAI0888765.1 FAD-NAD(P)-binding-domain-containing protein [Annulohypoxylon maeteangense]